MNSHIFIVKKVKNYVHGTKLLYWDFMQQFILL